MRRGHGGAALSTVEQGAAVVMGAKAGSNDVEGERVGAGLPR